MSKDARKKQRAKFMTFDQTRLLYEIAALRADIKQSELLATHDDQPILEAMYEELREMEGRYNRFGSQN